MGRVGRLSLDSLAHSARSIGTLINHIPNSADCQPIFETVLGKVQITESTPSDLIPRKALFGNPSRERVTVSRNGARIAYLAPIDGVMNLWVAPVDSPEDATSVTQDTSRGIPFYVWSHNPDFILYVQDTAGDENWHLYSVDLRSRVSTDLTPHEGVHAMLSGLSPLFPNEALVALNDRDARFHDVHRIDILTGESSSVQINDIGASGFVADDDFAVRLAHMTQPDGSWHTLSRSTNDDWETMIEGGVEDALTTHLLGFDSTGRRLYMLDSRGRDTSALVEIDTDTMWERELAIDDRADATGFIIHPSTRVPQAVAFEYDRVRWHVLDDSIAEDVEHIRRASQGDFHVVSRSHDDRLWVIVYDIDDGPARFYLYERETGDLSFLFSNRPDLEEFDLAPMRTAVLESRDGLGLVVYYTLPLDAGAREPLPTVLFVHGGPWGRDSWGYNAHHQLLANRGYAALSVNFRGSTGFGKAFVNAGDREWAGKMHDDLLDAVEWAVERRISDPDRIAIMGGSYGGYATLVGLTFTPDVFACGVDIVGPSNLNTLLDTVPPYWEPEIATMRARVGDNSTDEGRRFLAERSPLTHAGRITRPLLIAQGANDPRVKRAESDQIVEAMKSHGIPVTYVLFPDEGHGFARPENSLAFTALAEAFLSRCLGGSYEPIGDDFTGSSIQVVEGASGVPGLDST